MEIQAALLHGPAPSESRAAPPGFETACEVAAVLGDIDHTVARLAQWMQPVEVQPRASAGVRIAGKTMLRLVGCLFWPFICEMAGMNYLLSDPLIMDDTALQNLLGPIHNTPYDTSSSPRL